MLTNEGWQMIPLIRDTWRHSRKLYALVVIVWLAYMALLLIGPNGSGSIFEFGLSTTNLVRISFAIPVLVIWLIATRAVIGFKGYAHLLRETDEGQGFKYIADGLLLLLFYLMMILFFGRLAPYFYGTALLYPVVFIKNHAPVFTLLLSCFYLVKGSGDLLRHMNLRVPDRRLGYTWGAYFVFTAIYVSIFFNLSNDPASLSRQIPVFAVSHNVLLFSMVLPSLVAWILGIMACVNLSTLASKTKGIIYREALRHLVTGLYASILFAILVEILVFNSVYLEHIGITSVLIILYAFIVVYGTGYALIDRGARRLALIEVVGQA